MRVTEVVVVVYEKALVIRELDSGNKFVSIGYSIDLNCSRFTYQYIQRLLLHKHQM